MKRHTRAVQVSQTMAGPRSTRVRSADPECNAVPLRPWVVGCMPSGRTRRSALPRRWLWSLAVLGCWLGTVPMGPLIATRRSRRDHRNEPGVERSDTPGHPPPYDAGTPEGCVKASRSNTARSAVSRSGEPCPPLPAWVIRHKPSGRTRRSALLRRWLWQERRGPPVVANTPGDLRRSYLGWILRRIQRGGTHALCRLPKRWLGPASTVGGSWLALEQAPPLRKDPPPQQALPGLPASLQLAQAVRALPDRGGVLLGGVSAERGRAADRNPNEPSRPTLADCGRVRFQSGPHRP